MIWEYARLKLLPLLSVSNQVHFPVLRAWSLALRTQNKTYRSSRPSLGAEQGLRQSVMLCEEEKKTLEGRTGISLEVLIWLLMGPGGHSSIPRGTKLEVWPHRHPVIASSPLPQQSPLQYLPSELLVWKRQQNHPYTSLFSLFLIYI